MYKLTKSGEKALTTIGWLGIVLYSIGGLITFIVFMCKGAYLLSGWTAILSILGIISCLIIKEFGDGLYDLSETKQLSLAILNMLDSQKKQMENQNKLTSELISLMRHIDSNIVEVGNYANEQLNDINNSLTQGN